MTSDESTDLTIGQVLRRKIEEENKTIEDIDFILVGGLGLFTNDFWDSADQCDSNIENLKDEFKIVFKDGTWINKHYSRDGNIRLKYHKCPIRPVCILLHPTPQEYLDEPA